MCAQPFYKVQLPRRLGSDVVLHCKKKSSQTVFWALTRLSQKQTKSLQKPYLWRYTSVIPVWTSDNNLLKNLPKVLESRINWMNWPRSLVWWVWKWSLWIDMDFRNAFCGILIYLFLALTTKLELHKLNGKRKKILVHKNGEQNITFSCIAIRHTVITVPPTFKYLIRTPLSHFRLLFPYFPLLFLYFDTLFVSSQ